MLPPTKLQFFKVPYDSGCRAIWMLLLHLGVQFDIKDEMIVVTEEIKEDKNINTTYSQIPMVKDNTICIYETNTILRYIAQKFESQLYPTNLIQQTAVNQYLDWHLTNLQKDTQKLLELVSFYSKNHFIPPEKRKKPTVVGDFDTKLENEYNKYVKVLKVMENMLKSNNYLAGDFLSIADIIAASELAFSPVFNVDLATFPKLNEWNNRVKGEMKGWEGAHGDFAEFIEECKLFQQQQKESNQKLKKHGKDATGGNRPPDISHTVYFQTSRDQLMEMITSEAFLSQKFCTDCRFGLKSGSSFSYYDGNISGTNLYISDNNSNNECKILQSWRQNDWPKGKFSTVRLNLEKGDVTNPLDMSTQLQLAQNDVPPIFVKRTEELWDSKFWKPLGGILVRNILQQIFFENLSPHLCYNLLTDSALCSRMTRSKCEIGRGIGSDISYFDSFIVGKNFELVTDQKIVQHWRCSDWPANHFSLLTIEIKRVSGGTAVIHSQVNIPVDYYRQVGDLWDKNFWKKMQRYMET